MGILGEMKPGKPLWKVCYPAILTINWRNKATFFRHTYPSYKPVFFLLGPWVFFVVPLVQDDRSHRSPEKRPESSRDLLVIIVEGVPGKDQLIPQAAFKLHGMRETKQNCQFPHPKITGLWIWIKSRSKYGCTKYIWLHIWSIAVSLQIWTLPMVSGHLSEKLWRSQFRPLAHSMLLNRDCFTRTFSWHWVAGYPVVPRYPGPVR